MRFAQGHPRGYHSHFSARKEAPSPSPPLFSQARSVALPENLDRVRVRGLQNLHVLDTGFYRARAETLLAFVYRGQSQKAR